MLRTLLWWIRPEKSNHRDSLWYKGRALCYRSIMMLLRRLYRRYAISDTITLYKQGLIIVQERRDVEFEEALYELGVDVTPKMIETATLPKVEKPMWGHRPFLRFFHFTDTLHVYVNDKEILLKHNMGVTCQSDVDATVKISASSDIINRTWFRGELRQDVQQQIDYSSAPEKTMKSFKKQCRGVEIDESF